MIRTTPHIGRIVVIICTLLALVAFVFPDSWPIQRLDSISTVLLALLTGAYVFFTYKILDSTRPQPHVFVSLPSEQMDIFLSLKNIGNRPAYDVQITVDPSLDVIAPSEAFKGASSPMLRQTFLPPGTEIRNFVSSSVQVLSEKGVTTKFKIDIKYRDVNFRRYSDSYEIDVASYVYEKRFLSYDTVYHLNEISKTLTNINECLDKIRQPPAANTPNNDVHVISKSRGDSKAGKTKRARSTPRRI